MKKIYIPGFWNNEDVIFKNHIKEWEIIQKNLRWIKNTVFRKILEDNQKKIENRMFQKYAVSDEVYQNTKNSQFRWMTRDINLTVKLTIQKLLKYDEIDLLSGHSQWGYVLMKSILKEPELLDKIKEIELIAPVISWEIWKSFHKGKSKSYLHPKNVLVRKEYINSFESDNTFDLFLKVINATTKTKIKLILWEKDNVIPVDLFDLEEVKKYDFLNVEIKKDWDHYVWFRK